MDFNNQLMLRKVRRVAVIGFGNISDRHRRNLRTLFPHAKIVGLSSSGRVVARDIANVDEVVSSLNEIVCQHPDFAIVATPSTFHARDSLPLIAAGIPVLIEKPVAATLSDAQQIYSAVAKNNNYVRVAYCLRYLPSANVVKDVVRSQRLGELYNVFVEVGQYLPDWRPNRDYKETVSARAELGGGVLLELSHELDYLQWLLGPLSIKNSLLRTSSELSLAVEDLADIVAMSKHGAVVGIHLDFLQKSPRRKCRIVGSDAALSWDLVNNEVILEDRDRIIPVYADNNYDRNNIYIDMLKYFVYGMYAEINDNTSLNESVSLLSLIDDVRRLA